MMQRDGHGSGPVRPFLGGGLGSHNRAYSAGSRSSLAPMPVIAEDEVAGRTTTTTTNGNGVYGRPPPTVLPLRVPKRTQRKPTPMTIPVSMRAMPPPPYVPVTHLGRLSPSKEAPPPSFKTSSYSDSDGRKSLDGSWPQKPPPLPAGWADKQWFGSRRGRWLRFAGLVLLGLGLIAALVIGLTVGLRGNGGGSGGGDADNDNTSPDPPAPIFPAGSYSFETTLQQTNTSCSSNPAAWRCYPDVQGGNATFFWHVNDVTSGPSPYAVSSTENPFAPSFTNVSVTVLDEGTSEERLTFAFDMDKTVVPSDSLTPDNTAATCTFPGTRLEATLWTRKRNGTAVEPPVRRDAGDGRFPPWPCDVEIVQSKAAAEGDAPTCVDTDGNPIGDVTSGGGDCACNYANYVL